VDRIEEYQRRADDAAKQAERTRLPDLRRQWLDMAAGWRAMADQARSQVR